MSLRENEQKRRTIEEIHKLRELQKQYLKDWATDPEARLKAEEIDKKIILLSKEVEN